MTSKQASLLKNIVPEITEEDINFFHKITSTKLTLEQEEQVRNPVYTYPFQQEVLAVHWHPEFVPFPLIKERIEKLYPNKKESLIIPTQHNELLVYGNYAGVEVDCYARGFNQKVQLLFHFQKKNIENAHTFKNMLEHTRKYRASQLFEFLNAFTAKSSPLLKEGEMETGVEHSSVEIAILLAKKLEALIGSHIDSFSRQMLKNKLFRDFIDSYRNFLDNSIIDQVQHLVQAVKNKVKDNFSLSYFYHAHEFIEEARSLNGCVVIPHPEQFWPILLAGYDVDGYEIWNPQSQRYTEFLISAMRNQNERRKAEERELLVFMGDDTHLSEKVRPYMPEKNQKALREIGLQTAWEDISIQKLLLAYNETRKHCIQRYKERLGG